MGKSCDWQLGDFTIQQLKILPQSYTEKSQSYAENWIKGYELQFYNLLVKQFYCIQHPVERSQLKIGHSQIPTASVGASSIQ